MVIIYKPDTWSRKLKKLLQATDASFLREIVTQVLVRTCAAKSRAAFYLMQDT